MAKIKKILCILGGLRDETFKLLCLAELPSGHLFGQLFVSVSSVPSVAYLFKNFSVLSALSAVKNLSLYALPDEGITAKKFYLTTYKIFYIIREKLVITEITYFQYLYAAIYCDSILKEP